MKIEENAPPPHKIRGRGRKRKEATLLIRSMKQGSALLVDISETGHKSSQSLLASLTGYAARARKVNPEKLFTTRTMSETSCKIWRLE